MNAQLEVMSDQELNKYEQELLTKWIPRVALEAQIDRLNSQRSELLEIYHKLKNPRHPQNTRLIHSIKSLKHKLEDFEDELDDLIQDSQFKQH